MTVKSSAENQDGAFHGCETCMRERRKDILTKYMSQGSFCRSAPWLITVSVSLVLRPLVKRHIVLLMSVPTCQSMCCTGFIIVATLNNVVMGEEQLGSDHA